MNQSYLPFLVKQMETMPRNLRTALENYFRFQWNCKQLRLKRGTVWQILSFISQFSLKLYIQLFWKYFQSMILGRLGRGYCKKWGVRIFGQNFWLGCLSAFNNRVENPFYELSKIFSIIPALLAIRLFKYPLKFCSWNIQLWFLCWQFDLRICNDSVKFNRNSAGSYTWHCICRHQALKN